MNSTVGQRTTFRVQIPIVLATKDAINALDLQHERRVTGIEPNQTAPDGGSFRLLVIEDEITNRDLLIKMLKPFGFDMRYAVNGVEGVKAWEEWQPHLVWMDIRMPLMDGYEATQKIKALAETMGHSAIIIALTASAFDEDREAILKAGCDDFLRKPFREHEIFDVLHRHLGIRFIYEAINPAPDADVSLSTQDLLTAVEVLPVAWATNLYEAIISLNNDQMLAIIESVRPQIPHLADTLVQWVHNFEYKKLKALVAPDAK